MNHSAKLSSSRALFKRAASIAVSHTFPVWVDSTEFGVLHSSAVPRIRDSLILRLVAGRRQERGVSFIHATGAR
jgi:hypothetical protein